MMCVFPDKFIFYFKTEIIVCQCNLVGHLTVNRSVQNP